MKIMTVPSPQVVNADIAKVLILCGACGSTGEAKRLIAQKAVEIDGKVVSRYAVISDGSILKCGKRFWRKLRNTDTVTVDVSDTEDGVEIKVLSLSKGNKPVPV